jgi:adenine deaminase
MDRTELVDVALGRKPADVVIKGGHLVNVDTAEIEDGIDVALKGRRIALVGDGARCVGKNTSVIEAENKFIIPGLLDSHIHIESSMVTVTQFARAVLPRGTTGVFIDPHEIANVLGMRGVKLMHDEGADLPLKVFVTMPSCVPSAPGLETNGAEISLADVVEGLKWERVVGLAEVMDFPAVLSGNQKVHGEIRAALDRHSVVEGHAPGLHGSKLSAYIAAGIISDHESSTGDEAIEKLRLGMKLEIREGSGAKNLKALVESILSLGLDTRHCLLATDDRHPLDLISEGHMDHLVRRAMEEGLDPISAIQMATINIADHFAVDSEVGGISPGKLADIVIVNSLEKFSVEKVIADGKLVAENGKLVVKLPLPRYPKFAKRTINLKKVSPDDFDVKTVRKDEVDVRVIGLIEGQIFTEHEIVPLEVKDGIVKPDLLHDIVKVAVVERHNRTGNIGLGFVRGFGIKKGTIASSVGHDAHNVSAIGTNIRDMSVAVNAIARMGGGQVVVDKGRILSKIRLPIAGLMSDKPVEEVGSELELLRKRAKDLGIRLKSPFMQLSFLTLAVLPKLRITDRGLVDVEKFKLVDLITS